MLTPASRSLPLISATLSTLFAGALFAAAPSAPAAKTVHPAPAAKSAPAAQANEEDLPAEQVYKNIKVLRGMRAGDLDGAMSYFSASLGVGCNHCHVQGPTNHLAPEVDESPRKQTARRMIAMTRALNEKYFDGKQIVLCATCHAGHPKPTRIPPTDQAALRQSNEAPSAGGAPLPAPDAVLAKYKQAAGGAAKIAAVSYE